MLIARAFLLLIPLQPVLVSDMFFGLNWAQSAQVKRRHVF
jgi:hypothetical protein